MTADTRALRLADELIERFGIDLSGLTVLTEAASGPYLATPLVAARAGARRVYAWTRDSAYGPKEQVERHTLEQARTWGVEDRLEVSFSRPAEQVAEADLITNSGFVRPIDAQMVAAMKPTAVVALMWETWEFRESDLDLPACRERGVLVMGTWETRPPCDMRGYAGPLGVKLLLELGLEVFGSRVALLGAQPSLGRPMYEGLRALGAEVAWFGVEDAGTAGGPRPYEELPDWFPAHGASLDVLVVCEHHDPRLLLGDGGLLGYSEMARVNPGLRIAVATGNVDAAGLRASGLARFPAEVRPFGHMSHQPSELGPRPVLELYAAGLKVGQEMARARLRGLDPEAAAEEAKLHSPAMGFDETP